MASTTPAGEAPSGGAQGTEKDMKSMYGSSTESTVAVTETSKSALTNFEARMTLKLQALLAGEEALKQVKIAPGDVELLVRELEWSKPLAERVLRLAGGDVKALIKGVCG